MKKLLSVFALTAVFMSCDKKETTVKSEINTERIVSLNGAITETLATLEAGGKIVGRDVTSTYPTDLAATDLGHVRSITAESILALKPTVVFGTSKDINPALNEQLKNANIALVIIDQEYSAKGTETLITEVVKTLNNTTYQPLIDNINNQMAQVKPFEKKPKVLFIYARGAGNLMVAGKETALDAMITLAGAENAAGDLVDFKPFSPESLLTINPDVIVMFDSGLQSIGGVDGLLKVEGIAATNAGKNKKIISMDGQLLSGFGPRLGQAVLELHSKLE